MTLGRSTDGWEERRQSFFSPWTYCPPKLPFVQFILRSRPTGWLLRLWWKQFKAASVKCWDEASVVKPYLRQIEVTEQRKINNIWFHMWNLKNKTKSRDKTDSDTENKLMAARGEVGGDRSKIGWRGTLLFVKQISHRDVTPCGSIVSSTAVTLYGDRWLLNLAWWSMRHAYRCQITMVHTETNNVHYTAIRKRKSRTWNLKNKMKWSLKRMSLKFGISSICPLSHKTVTAHMLEKKEYSMQVYWSSCPKYSVQVHWSSCPMWMKRTLQ